MKIVIFHEEDKSFTLPIPLNVATMFVKKKMASNMKEKNKANDMIDMDILFKNINKLKEYKGLEVFSAFDKDGTGIKIII